MKMARISAVACMLVLVSGCSTHYLATSKFVASSQAEAPPELVATPKYDNVKGKVKAVVVKAPDNCLNRTADDASGAARTQDSVLKTTCGIEMAEIERALARKGFKVVSWKAMDMALRTNTKSISEVAAELGAEVVFQINSLETANKNMGKDARWERAYYRSDKFGHKVSDEALSDNARTYLRKSYLDDYEKRLPLMRQAVTLDANAILASTGESIWYYRWSHTEPMQEDGGRQVLLKCATSALKKADKLVQGELTKGAGLAYPDARVDCQITNPAIAKKEASPVVMSSVESDAVSVMSRPEDQKKVIYSELLGQVIQSLVSNFEGK